MIITPVNVAAVAESILMMLRNWPPLASLGAAVTRGAYVNGDPSKCPWIGIYPLGIEYPIRTLGLGSGYRRQRLGFAVITQQQTASADDDGAGCMDLLEAMNAQVISCLLSDPSLGNKVLVLDDFAVRYAGARQQAGEPNFQSSIITFTGETSVSGG